MDNMNLNIQELWITYQDEILKTAGKILVALLIWVIGRWIIKRVVNLFVKLLESRNVDSTLIPTLRSIVRIGLLASLIFAVVDQLGIPTSGFLAIFGVAGLAIGLSLQGSLSNIAGGILILILKPFKEGDYIEANGVTGTVVKVSIFNTILKNSDNNKTIYLANGALAGANITNFNQEKTRRLNLVFGISYSDDFEKAKRLLNELIKADQRILSDPAPFVRVSNLGANSVDITVKIWASTADYWNVNYDMLENVKKTFDKEGISFPFPQTDVHLYKEN